MDLAQLEIPDTISIHLEFPGVGKLYDDQKKKKGPMTIELFSPASKQAIEYGHKIQKQAIARMGKRGIKQIKMTPDEIDQQNTDRLVAFTASVINLTYNGELVTTETIEKVYADPKMGWICDQLNARLGSWDDFLDS